MAPSSRYSTNRFAQSSDASIDSYSFNDTKPTAPSSQSNNAQLPVTDLKPITLKEPLHIHVERAVREYFVALGDDMPTDLYELILKQVELPLLTVVLEQTRGNQSKCAKILGLNRGTLRKKLKTYNLMA